MLGKFLGRKAAVMFNGCGKIGFCKQHHARWSHVPHMCNPVPGHNIRAGKVF